MYTEIFDAIKAANIDVYQAGKHEGTITDACVVLADGGVRGTGKTTGIHLYYITCMVPVAKPTSIYQLITDVKTAVAGVEGIRPTGEQDDGAIIEDMRAYAVTLEYRAMCSLI